MLVTPEIHAGSEVDRRHSPLGSETTLSLITAGDDVSGYRFPEALAATGISMATNMMSRIFKKNYCFL